MSQEVKSNGPTQDVTTPSPTRGGRGGGGRGSGGGGFRGFRGGGRDGMGRGGFQNQALAAAGRKDHEASPGPGAGTGQRGKQFSQFNSNLYSKIKSQINVAHRNVFDFILLLFSLPFGIS